MDTNIGLLILMIIGGGRRDHQPLPSYQLSRGHHLENIPEAPLWV